MDILIVLVFLGALIGGAYWYIKIRLENDKKIIGVLKNLRKTLDGTDPVFPIITKSVALPGGQGQPLQTFEIRTVIDFKQKWEIYLVTPAGVQKHTEVEPNDLVVTRPKNLNDYEIGIHLSKPAGFISSAYLLVFEPFDLHPKKKKVDETLKLVKEFKSRGATIR